MCQNKPPLDVRPPRKAYCAPKLATHGDAKVLTQTSYDSPCQSLGSHLIK